jgi:hypothetical protein
MLVTSELEGWWRLWWGLSVSVEAKATHSGQPERNVETDDHDPKVLTVK